MSRVVKEYTVLISCPSDVKKEKDVIKKVIDEFNRTHSYNYGVVFKDIEWKLGTYSSVGEDPQSQINRQIVDESDMAVALFWNRVGDETKNNISGTVEEIEKLCKQNKQVFLYFSSKPILANNLDINQFERLQDIKKKYQNSSIYKEYSTINEFKNIFENEFNLYVARNIENAQEPLKRGLFSIVPNDIKSLQAKINQAEHSIFLSGMSLISTLSISFAKCDKLNNIHVLITKEEANLIKECAKLSDTNYDEFVAHIQLVKKHYYEMSIPNNMEIRCIDAVMPCSLIGIDIDKPDGRIFVRQYLYKQSPVECPHYACYHGDQWYNVYRGQIDSLWKDSEEIDFNSLDGR